VALWLQSLPFLCLQKSALVLATPKQLTQIPIIVLVVFDMFALGLRIESKSERQLLLP